MIKLKANERSLIERVLQSPLAFTWGPCPKGGTHARLLRSSGSPSQVKHLRRFALAGLLSEKITDSASPPEHTVTYTITALGREAIDHYAAIAPRRNADRAATDSELLREAIQ